MPSTSFHFTVAVRETGRSPYKAVRLLGPRAKPRPGEVAVPIRLDVDDLLLSKVTNQVNVSVQAPAVVEGAAEGRS